MSGYGDQPSYPLWWNALGTTGKLTLDLLKAEMQKVSICALCGLSLAGQPAYTLPEDQTRVQHKACRKSIREAAQ